MLKDIFCKIKMNTFYTKTALKKLLLLFVGFFVLGAFILFPQSLNTKVVYAADDDTGYSDRGFDPVCIGEGVSEYMEEMLQDKDSYKHIRFLSPAFNMTNTRSQEIVANMDLSLFSEVDAIAGNSYNMPDGSGGYISIMQNVNAFMTGTGLKSINNKVMITEMGDVTVGNEEGSDLPYRTADTSWIPNLTSAVAEVRSSYAGINVLGGLFFNNFNINTNWKGFEITDSELNTICGGSCGSLGSNSADYYTRPVLYGKAASKGMKYTLEISNADASTTEGVKSALAAGLTPIIRVGTSVGAGPTAATYRSYLAKLDTELEAIYRGDTSKFAYAIAGPNEPQSECWATPECGSCNVINVLYEGAPLLIKGIVKSNQIDPITNNSNSGINGVTIAAYSGRWKNYAELPGTSRTTGKCEGDICDAPELQKRCTVSGKVVGDESDFACESAYGNPHYCDPLEVGGGNCNGHFALETPISKHNFNGANTIAFFCNGEVVDEYSVEISPLNGGVDEVIDLGVITIPCPPTTVPTPPPDSYTYVDEVGILECRNRTYTESEPVSGKYIEHSELATVFEKEDKSFVGNTILQGIIGGILGWLFPGLIPDLANYKTAEKIQTQMGNVTSYDTNLYEFENCLLWGCPTYFGTPTRNTPYGLPSCETLKAANSGIGNKDSPFANKNLHNSFGLAVFTDPITMKNRMKELQLIAENAEPVLLPGEVASPDPHGNKYKSVLKYPLCVDTHGLIPFANRILGISPTDDDVVWGDEIQCPYEEFDPSKHKLGEEYCPYALADGGQLDYLTSLADNCGENDSAWECDSGLFRNELYDWPNHEEGFPESEVPSSGNGKARSLYVGGPLINGTLSNMGPAGVEKKLEEGVANYADTPYAPLSIKGAAKEFSNETHGMTFDPRRVQRIGNPNANCTYNVPDIERSCPNATMSPEHCTGESILFLNEEKQNQVVGANEERFIYLKAPGLFGFLISIFSDLIALFTPTGAEDGLPPNADLTNPDYLCYQENYGEGGVVDSVTYTCTGLIRKQLLASVRNEAPDVQTARGLSGIYAFFEPYLTNVNKQGYKSISDPVACDEGNPEGWDCEKTNRAMMHADWLNGTTMVDAQRYYALRSGPDFAPHDSDSAGSLGPVGGGAGGDIISTCNEFDCNSYNAGTFENSLACHVSTMREYLFDPTIESWKLIETLGSWCDKEARKQNYLRNLLSTYDQTAPKTHGRSCTTLPPDVGEYDKKIDDPLGVFDQCSQMLAGELAKQPGYPGFDHFRQAIIDCPIPSYEWPQGTTITELENDICNGPDIMVGGIKLNISYNCGGTDSRVSQVLTRAYEENVNPWLMLSIWAAESQWGLGGVCYQ